LERVDLAAFEQDKPMKTKWLAGCILLAGAMMLRAQTNDLSTALQKGLFEEEANRNLDAAVSNYLSLAEQFDRDRQVAATAIFRLGECYRKLGRDDDAVVQYQRILREFPDQQTLATLSWQNLTALHVAVPPQLMTAPQPLLPGDTNTFQQKQILGILTRATADTNTFAQRLRAVIQENSVSLRTPADFTARAAALDAEAGLLKGQMTLISRLKGEDRRIAVQQNFPNPVLTTLMQQLAEAEQKLAGLTNEYALEAVPVVNATALVNTIKQQIDAQVDGVVKGLQAKLEADQATAEMLRAQAGSAPSARAESLPTTDDEDREIQRIQQMIQNSPDLINAPGGNRNTPLAKAAFNGWLKVANFLLDHGAGVNVGDPSPLNQAVVAGNRAMTELLLNRGADVNANGSQGAPLHQAANWGFQAVTEALLSAHSDVNALNRNGVTPLFLAASAGREKIVQMLLAAGAKVNLKDDKGRTVLNYAIENSPEIFQALLDAGTNPNTEDSSGRTPLSYAAERDNPKVVKLLLAAKADPNGGKLDAPLLCAIHKQDVASAELLLQAGANPNAKTMADWEMSFGGSVHPQGAAMTPLFLAVSMHQLPMVNLLLKFKADPNDSQTDGKPLLFSALSNPDILGVLLDAGGQVDSHLSGGMMLLDQAVDGYPPIAAVEILLKHGADPNARDLRGNTPLVYALWGADPQKIELLLDHHADPNVRGENGQTSLDYIKSLAQSNIDPASKADFDKIAGLLRSHGALDNLPHWDVITVSRPSANYSKTVFQKGTNDWNRFTLLETLLNFYPEQSFHQPRFGGSTDSEISLPFPDLTRVTIIHHKQNTTNETRIKVDLLNATNGIDCSRDVPLEFGDVVEIPEREHALGDVLIGLTDSQRAAMANCLTGSAQLLVRDQKVKILLYPDPGSSLIGAVLNGSEARKILLSSSDLSCVKVTRRDPATGKKYEWVINCTPTPEAVPTGAGSDFTQRLQAIIQQRSAGGRQFGAMPDLWLRDGDVIEVPEK
jgi:ankyrin repeat protein